MIMKTLCELNWHSYKDQVIWRVETPYSTLTLEGGVCQRPGCGKIRPADAEEARLLATYLLTRFNYGSTWIISS